MSREEMTDRILYGHYLEQLYSTATGRIDRLISTLIFILGSAIVLKANPFYFGVLVVILTAIQTCYAFGKKSGAAQKKAFDYLKLYTNASKYTEEEIRDRLLDLESTDEIIWSILQPIALLKTQIRLGVHQYYTEKLPFTAKLFKAFLC